MSTRSQKKSITPVKIPSIASKRVENSWVLLMKNSIFENNNFNIITLPHPAHNKPTKYCLDDIHNRMYEVVTFSEPYRSWFIGDTVKSDGSLQILSPVNPLFLVLPRLKELCSSRAIPLEDLMSEKGFDKVLDFVTNLDSVADLKGPADIKAYKYNEDKTLTFLEERVRRLAKVLRDKNVHVTTGAVSATFVKSNISCDSVDDEFYLKYAHGIVSEYLQHELMLSLEKRFNFNPDLIESIGKKRKSEVEGNETNKRVKHDVSEIDFKENLQIISEQRLNELKKQKPLSAKEKARQKAASGTKTISAFFSKK